MLSLMWQALVNLLIGITEFNTSAGIQHVVGIDRPVDRSVDRYYQRERRVASNLRIRVRR